MPRTSTRSRTRLPPHPPLPLQQQQRGQVGIQSFARTSKPGVTPPPTAVDGKEKAALALPASPSKKRKLNEIAPASGEGGDCEKENEEQTQQEQQRLEGEDADAVTATPSKILRFSDLSVSTPQSSSRSKSRSRSVRRSPCSSSSSPTVRRTRTQTQTTITAFAKATKANPLSRSLLPTLSEKSSSSASTTATSAPEQSDQSDSPSPTPNRRPPSFYDLLSLHLCFLKALALHFAHNGPSTPADLREFVPSVERMWRKRKVVTKDLQRLIRVWDEQDEEPQEEGKGEKEKEKEKEGNTASTVPRFRIANYGLGKVCLERVGGQQSVSGGLFDEKELQGRFERKLERMWRRTVDSSSSTRGEGDGNQVDNFVEKIPLAPIHESLTPFTSFRKGQQRLQDLKGGVIRLKTAKLAAKTEEENDSAKKAPEAASDRRKGLLDRIKDKQLRQSKLPPPPSKETLLRRSAAQRVEEVAGVLAMLRPSGSVGSGPWAIAAAQKKPYRLETVIQNVKDSVRNPISDGEVEICLNILAQKEVAGDWVNLVTVNELRSVVLKSGRDASPKEIGARVAELKIGWEDCPPGQEGGGC